MSKKIMIYGWFGENNIGDELLLKAIIKLIKKTDENSKIIVAGSNPKNIKKNHSEVDVSIYDFYLSIKQLIKLLFRNPIKFIYNMISSDILIVPGGGAISDWNLESTKRMFFMINFFSLMKKKIYLFGMGAGPITNEKNYSYFKKVLAKASYITVRDDYSKKELEKIGLSNVYKSKDLVLNMNFNLENNSKDKKEKIGLILAPVCVNNEKIFNKFVKEITKLIDKLQNQYEVSLIPFQYSYDKILLDKIVEKTNVNILYDSNNIWSSLDYIKEQDIIIAMRYHSIILGLLNGKKVVPIIYHPKCNEISNLFEIQQYSSYIGDGTNWKKSNIDSTDLYKKIAKIDNDNFYNNKVKKITKKIQKECLELQILKEILK